MLHGGGNGTSGWHEWNESGRIGREDCGVRESRLEAWTGSGSEETSDGERVLRTKGRATGGIEKTERRDSGKTDTGGFQGGLEEGRGRSGRSRGVSRGLDEETWRKDRHREGSRGLEEDRLRIRETGDYRDSRVHDHDEVREYRPERKSRQRGTRAEREESREEIVEDRRGESRRERSGRRRDESANDAVPSWEQTSRREQYRDGRTPERRRGEELRVDDGKRRFAPGADSEEEQGGQIERSRRREPKEFSDGEGTGAAVDVRGEGDADADVVGSRDGRHCSRRDDRGAGTEARETPEQQDGTDGGAEYGDTEIQLDEDDLAVADQRFRAGLTDVQESVQFEGEERGDRGLRPEGEPEVQDEAGAADGAVGDEEGGAESREERRRRRKERRHRHREERGGQHIFGESQNAT